MDYTGILKRAWDITWRNKTLWVLGLFAGGGASFNFNLPSSSGTSWREGASTSSMDLDQLGAFGRWLESGGPGGNIDQWIPLLIALAFALLAIGLLYWVLSIAATGGLIKQVDVAASGYKPSAMQGWRDGFAKWWRVLGMSFVVMLPVVLVAMLIFGIAIAMLLGPMIAAGGFDSDVAPAVMMSGILPMLGVALFGMLILIPLSIVLSVVLLLGLRYAVIEDRGWSDSISAGWQAFKGRFKDVALFWLVMLVVGMVFGIAFALGAVAFIVPVVATAIGGLWPVTALLTLLLVAVAVVIGAGYSTFVSASWTLFWRQMSGREWSGYLSPGQSPYPAQPSYPVQPVYPGQPYYPAPAPPAAPGWDQPPTPPAPPAPMAPPAGGPPESWTPPEGPPIGPPQPPA